MAAAALASGAAIAADDDDGVPLTGDDFLVGGHVKIRPGTYHVVDANGDGVIHVRGEFARLDLTGVTLVGHAADAAPAPDEFAGVGVSVEDAHVPVVTGGTIRGFKVGVRVRGSSRATVEGVDASRNFRQRLRSTVEREDASDWLRPHDNDAGEWETRYGAGIACSDARGVVVRGCTVRNGQNGILLQRCDDAKAYDNDVSFNSGWGIALWRTRWATVCRNNADWCVRGFSHGRYARGQDSAGILVFEQCSANRFALNSATHGGDGFFLFAGNDTLEGRSAWGAGSDRNLLWRNDFSHAVANGIEATFSRGNAMRENDLRDCEHGVWAGYSSGTEIVGNRLADCSHGVSIEHGERNEIHANAIERCGVGVHLWTDDDPELAATPWGRWQRGSPSRGNSLVANAFAGNRVDVRLVRDAGSEIADGPSAEPLRIETEDVTDLRRGPGVDPVPPLRDVHREDAFPGTRDPRAHVGPLRGRRYILVDAWGPVDPRETRLFPSHVDAAGEARLSVLGVDGGFEVTSLTDGFVAEPSRGALPATVAIRRADGAAGASRFDVEVTAKGTKHRAAGTVFTTAWDVRFFRWTTDPRGDADAFATLLAGEPAERRTLPALDFAWQGGAVSDAVGGDGFATLATTEVALPAGAWTLRTVSDDGIRVWVDGRLVVDDWTHHGPTPHEAALDFAEAATHRLRVEHFELDGWAALSVTLVPR